MQKTTEHVLRKATHSHYFGTSQGVRPGEFGNRNRRVNPDAAASPRRGLRGLSGGFGMIRIFHAYRISTGRSWLKDKDLTPKKID